MTNDTVVRCAKLFLKKQKEEKKPLHLFPKRASLRQTHLKVRQNGCSVIRVNQTETVKRSSFAVRAATRTSCFRKVRTKESASLLKRKGTSKSDFSFQTFVIYLQISLVNDTQSSSGSKTSPMSSTSEPLGESEKIKLKRKRPQKNLSPQDSFSKTYPALCLHA